MKLKTQLAHWKTYLRITVWQSFGVRLGLFSLSIFNISTGFVSSLGLFLSRVALTDIEYEEEKGVVHFRLIWVKRPLRIRKRTLTLPVNRIHKIEYFPSDEDHMGQIHLLVKQSRKPSNEYTVLPSNRWYFKMREINQLVKSYR